MFDSIKQKRQLDSKQFVEMVGTFVQRIPYVLVHDATCEQLLAQNPNDEFIQQYHREGKQCLQNCKYGLQAPAEFGYNLKKGTEPEVTKQGRSIEVVTEPVEVVVSITYK